MSTDSSFNESNSAWLDGARPGSPVIPAYMPTADWLSAFEVEPELLIRRIEHWWTISTSAVDQILSGKIPNVPTGYTGLTDLLVLYADRVGTINSTPLRALHDAVYAREGQLHDLVTATSWLSLTAIQELLADSLPIRDRIKSLALSRIEAINDDSENARRTQAFRERVAKIRSVSQGSGRTDLSREEIQKGLERKYGTGICLFPSAE